MDNFDFLKQLNKDLYKTIQEAEKLFKDEYFEQAIVQVRCYAEKLAKDIVKDKMSPDDTFDNIIQKLKDNSFENIRKKEFVDDLYFIKTNGNKAAHEGNISNNGEVALECLERAFELGIFYSHIKNGYDKTLDTKQFSEELLMTGQKNKKSSLKENYKRILEEERENYTFPEAKPNRTKRLTKSKKTIKSKKVNKSNSLYTNSTNTGEETTNSYIIKIIFSALVFLTILIFVLFILKFKN